MLSHGRQREIFIAAAHLHLSLYVEGIVCIERGNTVALSKQFILLLTEYCGFVKTVHSLTDMGHLNLSKKISRKGSLKKFLPVLKKNRILYFLKFPF